MVASLTPIHDPDWYLYDEYDYIEKMGTLYIHSLYKTEINKVTSNIRDSLHYDTSKPCDMGGKTGHTFDECELLKNMTSWKIRYPILTVQEAVE